MLITGALIEGVRADCRLHGDRITEVGRLTREAGEQVIDAHGGALIPGLADHHLHLLACAAARTSVNLEDCPDRSAMIEALARAAERRSAVRAVGWYEGSHGPLDAATLDAFLPAAGRIQVGHRSGALWVLNSRALHSLESLDHPGVERDEGGRPTGLLWRADVLLRGSTPLPDLAEFGRTLASYGITHATDATPDLDAGALGALSMGALPQRLLLLGAPDGWGGTAGVSAGPAKIVVPDHELPELEALALRIEARHRAGRAVALHCVTRAALVLALAAWREAGSTPGDRVEHAAVAGPAEAAAMAELGLLVVTQPSLVARRGASYASDIEPADREDLWPYASLLGKGVPVACSSDAPYGDLDPWATIRAARDRATPGGVVVGTAERVSAATALRSMLSDPRAPGGPARRVVAGAEGSLVVLRTSLDEALAEPDANLVRHTFCAGRLTASV